MTRTRAELVAHCGGSPSVTQRALIERAVNLTVVIAAMDAKFAEAGTMTEHDCRTYLAWVNAFGRLMRHLGLEGPKASVPSLADIIAAGKGKAA